MSEPLLKVTGLAVDYPGRGWRAKPVRVLHDVDIEVLPGETVGVVGESGSGKTTLGRAVLGLVPAAAGEIRYDGTPIGPLGSASRLAVNGQIQAVFQDPFRSLNPVLRIGRTLSEPLLVKGVAADEAQTRVAELLEQVGLPAGSARRLPREFSGGQRQRIAIARALALDPRLIVCDEPVSALDLSTQKRVLDLFLDIQQRTGVAYLFVSHDLSVVRHLSHRVAVFHRGAIVEQGPGAEVTSDPVHPYTRKLLLASPVADPERQAERRAERLRQAEGAGPPA
ncbi:ATP-binding cassette domain-containing protein [Streptomyces sp. NPDC059818]|uniref:ATP-binding cassette domain-containing protein n=1 Tax=Streptomyces sp. NPDC059818 TaxID=3346962 RepID=UPI003647A52B